MTQKQLGMKHRGIGGFVLATLLLVLVLVSGQHLTASANNPESRYIPGLWTEGCVDCPKRFGYPNDHSIQLDSKDRPHIVYGAKDIYHAWYDGEEWQYQTVRLLSDHGKIGTSLALDSNDNPHISFYAYPRIYGSAPWKIGYAWFDGDTWRSHVSDDVLDEFVFYNAIVLDRNDRPHIAYFSTDGLRHTWYDGAGWQIESISPGKGPMSMVIDDEGVIHISYVDGDFVKYSTQTETGWSTTVVAPCGWNSIAVTDGGHPRVVCESDLGTVYAWLDGVEWQSIIVDSIHGGQDTSLALDSHDLPHIIYAPYSEAIRHTWFDGVWHIEAVPFEEPHAAWTSIAVDQQDRLHITYGADYHGLWYASSDGLSWAEQFIDRSGTAGWEHSVVKDSSGTLHAIYDEDFRYELSYSWNDGDGWQRERLEIDFGDGWYKRDNSVAVDSQGRPHLAVAVSGDRLIYAWRDATTTWYTETIESMVRASSVMIAIDHQDNIHVSYYDEENGDLRYAKREANVWHREIVDDTEDSGRSASLALGDDGLPRISYIYYYRGEYILKYAYQDGTHWVIETVDSSPNPKGSAALALDGEGQPHISYISGYRLGHAWRDDAQWRTEVVPTGFVNEYNPTAIAVSSGGTVHILHYSAGNREYLHSWYDGGEWHTEVVFEIDELWVPARNSVLLDENERPMFSYFDSYRDELKFFRQIDGPHHYYLPVMLH